MREDATTRGETDTLRLIVIEDDMLQSMDLEQSLEEMGHRVLAVAQHVPAALQAVRAHGRSTDLVLLDLTLAGTPADPVIRELRMRGIPFMAVTGLRLEDVRSLSPDCPVVQKPYSPSMLRDGLRQATAR